MFFLILRWLFACACRILSYLFRHRSCTASICAADLVGSSDGACSIALRDHLSRHSFPTFPLSLHHHPPSPSPILPSSSSCNPCVDPFGNLFSNFLVPFPLSSFPFHTLAQNYRGA